MRRRVRSGLQPVQHGGSGYEVSVTSLNLSSGCVNFRDAGMFVNLILGQHFMREGRLHRGGKIDFVSSDSDIGSLNAIIELLN